MNLRNEQTKEIYNQFNGEKVISSIKTPNLEIKFVKSYIWVIPIFMLFGITSVLPILLDSEKIIGYMAAAIAVILSVFGFLSQYYKLYFDNNNLIIENKLNKRITIDINRYPRVYVRHQTYKNYNNVTKHYETRDRYNLHIEQDNNDFVLDIRIVGSKKIEQFLNSIEIKERKDVTDSQWKSSSSEKERTFSDYITFLRKQEKIIGVKDKLQKINIKNDSGVKKKFKICTILIIISFMLDYVLNFVVHISTGSIFKNMFMTIGCILGFFDFVFFIMLIDKGKGNSLKISYPSDESIKINKYLLKYKINDIMLDIKVTQPLSSTEKYNYILIIRGKNNSYSIELNLEQEQQLGEFIDNLIFEPRKV